MKFIKILLSLLLSLSLVGCSRSYISTDNSNDTSESTQVYELYTVLNDNQPDFDESDYTSESYIKLSELDELGRTGVAMACLSQETMPDKNEERENISYIKPSGWNSTRYDESLVEGELLFNRCHQIAWCLSSLNAEPRNLMTGTRSFNTEGMLPFENEVANYIDQTNHHVIYRSTPEFTGDELVARSLHLEAASVEDEKIRINVRIYNVQEGFTIDYATGDNYYNGSSSDSDATYIINVSSGKFHKTDCEVLNDTKSKNKKSTTKSRSELIREGYEPCGACNP